MSIVDATYHNSLIAVPLDHTTSATECILDHIWWDNTYLARWQGMILSQCSEGRVFILAYWWMLNRREDRVRVPLWCPQVLQDWWNIGGPSCSKACRDCLLVGPSSSHGGVRGLNSFEWGRHNHIKIKLLRLHIFNTTSIDRGQRTQTICLFVTGRRRILRHISDVRTISPRSIACYTVAALLI